MSLLVNHDEFTQALQRIFSMERDDAREIADVVLEKFERDGEVDDDTLDADLRSVFYTLEAKKMLAFRRVEYTRDDGDRRRAFFWRLREDGFEEHASEAARIGEDVYASLPATAWRHAG